MAPAVAVVVDTTVAAEAALGPVLAQVILVAAVAVRAFWRAA
jgi:hypothetical protein